MDNYTDKNPTSTGGGQNTPNSRLNDALNLIADRIDVLASKYDKTEADKEKENAESRRKKAHDDRTYRRQGWAITVAAIALTLNLISLVGLAVQARTARNAVRVAQQAFEINTMPSIAFEDKSVQADGNTVNFEFHILNHSTGAVYIYDNPIQYTEKDTDISYNYTLSTLKTLRPFAQIFPGGDDGTKRRVILSGPLDDRMKGKQLYTTFSVLASSSRQEPYLISECIIFTWDGSKFTSEGKLCEHNQRYERLADYVTHRND